MNYDNSRDGVSFRRTGNPDGSVLSFRADSPVHVGGGELPKERAPTFAAGALVSGPGRIISDDYKLSTAFHEAGHISANFAVGLTPMVFATINSTLGRSGHVELPLETDTCGRLHQFSIFSLHDVRRSPLPKVINGKPLTPTAAVVLFARAVVAIAGGEAVRMNFAGHYDLERDRNDVAHAEICAGLVTGDPAAFLVMAREDARRIITVQSHQVEAVAKALMQFGSLNAGEIEAALSARPDAVRRRQMEVMAANAALFTATHGELKRLTI